MYVGLVDAGALIPLLSEAWIRQLRWCSQEVDYHSLKTISVVCPWIGVWKPSNLSFQGATLAYLTFERLDGMRQDRRYWLSTLPHRFGTARQVDNQAIPSSVSYFSRKAGTIFQGGSYSVTNVGISSEVTSFL